MRIKNNWLRILIFVVITAIVVSTLWLSLAKVIDLLSFIISLFLPFLLGYVFASAVKPLADVLQKKLSIPKGLSAILVIILTIGIIGGALTWGIWKIVEQFRQVYEQFPLIYASLQQSFAKLADAWWDVYVSLPDNVQQILSEMGQNISQKASGFIDNKSAPVVDWASRFAKAVPRVFVGVVVFILSGYFIITDDGRISAVSAKIVGEKIRYRFSLVGMHIKNYLGGYLKAQGVLMLIAFVIIFIAIKILGVKYALLIALATAFLDALPFFGSGLVLWPWAIIDFATGDIKMGVGLIITYLAVAIVRRFAEPKLLSSNMGLHPLLTLMSMYVGYRILSIGGLILGPIIAMLIISFYKAGIFDPLIAFVKLVYKFTKEQLTLLKDFFIKLAGSDWNE